VRQRLQNAGVPPFWKLCRAAEEFRATTVLPNNSFHSLHYQRRVENPDSKGRLKKVNKIGEPYWYLTLIYFPSLVSLRLELIGGSLLGELTDQGRVTTMALGERIRKLYVDKLGFLPQTLEDENTLYLRWFPPSSLQRVC